MQHCLALLESSLDISFNVDLILPHVKPVRFEANKRILTRGEEEGREEGVAPEGIFVVDEGVVAVLSPSGDTVLNRLLPGEFFGELSTLFDTQCTASVMAAQR